jgi:hypothetical protein
MPCRIPSSAPCHIAVAPVVTPPMKKAMSAAIPDVMALSPAEWPSSTMPVATSASCKKR